MNIYGQKMEIIRFLFQFLYPSKDESHKLLRFLVERLPESSQNRDAFDDIATRYSSNDIITGW